MSSAPNKLDNTEQFPFASDPPAATGLFRVTSPATEIPPSNEVPEGMDALVDLPYRDARKHAIGEFERLYIAALLERCGGNVSHAARIAGVDRVYLHRLLRKHALRGSKRSRLTKSDVVPAPIKSDVVPAPIKSDVVPAPTATDED